MQQYVADVGQPGALTTAGQVDVVVVAVVVVTVGVAVARHLQALEMREAPQVAIGLGAWIELRGY